MKTKPTEQTLEILQLLSEQGFNYPLSIGVLDDSVRNLMGKNVIEHIIERSEIFTCEEELVTWLESREDKHIVFIPEKISNPASVLAKKSAEARKKKGFDYSALGKKGAAKRWKGKTTNKT